MSQDMVVQHAELKGHRNYPRLRRWINRTVYFCLMAIAVGTCLHWYTSRQVAAYTSHRQAAIPKVKMPRQKLAAIESRLEAFKKNARAGRPLERDLVLTTDEVNALVHKEPRLRDAIYLRIVDNRLRADVSLPADLLPGGDGRYFNAEVTCDLSIKDDKLHLSVADAQVDGRAVPEAWLGMIRDRNFAKPLYNDREISQLLANVDSVEIEEDAIRFRLRRAANAVQLARQARYAQCERGIR